MSERLSIDEFFRQLAEREEAARAASGLPHATPERQQEMQERVLRLHAAAEPLMAEVRAAYQAGFSCPFLVEAARCLLDEKFWHPGDEMSRRESRESESRRLSVETEPNPEERA